MRKYACIAAALLPIALSGCTRQREGTASASDAARGFQAEHAAWVKQREDELRKPDGWTSLIGLHWIEGAVQSVGGAERNDIRLAIAPDVLGKVERRADAVYFVPAAGAALTVDGRPLQGETALKVADKSTGTTLGYDDGKGKISLISRAGHLALRVHHTDAPTRRQFDGLDFWPADPAWQVQANFVAYPPGRALPIVNKIGNTNDTPTPGYVEFEKDGRKWRLEAFGDPAKGLNLMFRDATSGHESYGVGRYLKTEAVADDGSVVIDFNRAYNPPCAYTEFATCPLPPRQNDLGKQVDASHPKGLAVLAGEKKYAVAHS